MHCLDLFSGFGGFALASKWVGFKTIQFVEVNPYAQRVLRKNFPGVPIHGDIKTYSASTIRVDIVTGGFPCQDNSLANQRGRGLEGERSGLWFEMLRIASECNPSFVVVENIPPSKNRRWDLTVKANLEELDYTTAQIFISAASVGANHLRNRLFIVAYSNRLGGNAAEIQDILTCPVSHQEKSTWWEGSGELRRGDSGRVFLTPRSWTPRVDDGFPGWVERFRGLGNAVVPQVAMIPLRRIADLSRSLSLPIADLVWMPLLNQGIETTVMGIVIERQLDGLLSLVGVRYQNGVSRFPSRRLMHVRVGDRVLWKGHEFEIVASSSDYLTLNRPHGNYITSSRISLQDAIAQLTPTTLTAGSTHK